MKVIGLAEAGSDFMGQIATLAGPGWLKDPEDGGSAPEELFMKVSLKVGTETGEEFTTKGQLCATSPQREPWASGCSGDSGSPLFICSNSSIHDCTVIAVIVGRPGHGTQGNCQGDSAGPSVSILRPWIDQVMEGSKNVTLGM